jgi:hypothetical protein
LLGNGEAKLGDAMKKALTFAILLMFAVPSYARDQRPATAKLKADAEKVVRTISGDKAKSQIYCQIADLGNEIDQEKDSKKAQALFQKMNELQKQLGPEYIAFLADSQDVDPDSKDGQDIISTFDELDEACPD